MKKLDKANLSDMLFGSSPDKNKLLLVLEKISDNISAIEIIHQDKQHYEF